MDSNIIYNKIRNYAYNALHPEVKTFVRGRGKYQYDTIDTSLYATKDELKETEEELLSQIDTKAELSELDKTNEAVALLEENKADKSTLDDYLTKEEAAETYQPIGDYATVTYVDEADKMLREEIKDLNEGLNDLDDLVSDIEDRLDLTLSKLTAGDGIVIEDDTISVLLTAEGEDPLTLTCVKDEGKLIIKGDVAPLLQQVDTISTDVDTLSTDVDELKEKFTSFNLFIPVTELPTENIDTHAIYLVPSESTASDNIFIEYIYVNNAWEKLGEATINTDLSDYYTKEQTDALIAAIPTVPFTTVQAESTAPLTLTATIEKQTLQITGSVDTYSKGEIDDLLEDTTALAEEVEVLEEEVTEIRESVYNLYDNIFVVCSVRREEADETCLARLSAVAEGAFLNYDMHGIAIVEDGKMLIVSLYEAPTALPFASTLKTLFGTSKTMAEAVIDLDGAGNTDLILNGSSSECITDSSSYAAGYCNSYGTSRLPEGSWYLPSLYELLIIKKYIREINYAINIVGGDLIRYENLEGLAYWSSTEWDQLKAWQLNMYESHLIPGNKAEQSYYVRPVTVLGHTNEIATKTRILTVDSISFGTDNTIPYYGGTYNPAITCTLHTYVDGEETTAETVTPTKYEYVIASFGEQPSISYDSSTGAITLGQNTSEEQYGYAILATIYYGDICTVTRISISQVSQSDTNYIIFGLSYVNTLIIGLHTTFESTALDNISPLTYSDVTYVEPGERAEKRTTVTTESVFSGFAVLEGEEWLHVTDDGVLSMDANTDTSSRVGTVYGTASYTDTTTGKTYSQTASTTITQEGKSSYSLTLDDLYYNNHESLPATAASYTPTVDVTLHTLVDGMDRTQTVYILDANSAWQILEKPEWITLLSTTYNGMIDVEENTTSEERSAVIDFTGSYTAPDGTVLTVHGLYTIIQKGV